MNDSLPEIGFKYERDLATPRRNSPKRPEKRKDGENSGPVLPMFEGTPKHIRMG